MNRVTLTGNLVKDVELRYTQSNVGIGSFALAVKRPFKNSNGEYDSDFIDCVAYQNTAELMQKYTSKGSKILVEGRLQKRDYQAKDGSKRYVTEVIGEKIEFLSKKEITEDNSKAEAKQEQPTKVYMEDIQLTDDDLPF